MAARATIANNTPSMTPTRMPTVDNDELVVDRVVESNSRKIVFEDVASDEDVTFSVEASDGRFSVGLAVLDTGVSSDDLSVETAVVGAPKPGGVLSTDVRMCELPVVVAAVP